MEPSLVVAVIAGGLATILDRFTPATHPVFWRILVFKALLARMVIEVLANRKRPLRSSQLVSRLENNVETRNALKTELGAAETDSAFESALAHLRRRVREVEAKARLA